MNIKRILILLIIPIFAFAQLDNALKLHPEMNGWNTDTMSLHANIGANIWRTTIQATANDDTSEFLLMNHDWANRWLGELSLNSVDSLDWYTSDPEFNAKIITPVTENNYYTFRMKDNGYSNTVGVVLETSAPPVNITDVSLSPDTVLAEDEVTVNITLDNSPCAEEIIYVRYTTDNWQSHNFVEATGSGTDYTATLPAQSPGTNLNLYVLTTTLNWSNSNDLENYPDLMSLRTNTNSGNNYSYAVNSPPVINAPEDQEILEGETLDMELTANDPDQDDLNWTALNLPNTANFTDNGDGTAQLIWTPDYDEQGQYTITIIVDDGKSETAQTFNMEP